MSKRGRIRAENMRRNGYYYCRLCKDYQIKEDFIDFESQPANVRRCKLHRPIGERFPAHARVGVDIGVFDLWEAYKERHNLCQA